jgi:hypothetical protein
MNLQNRDKITYILYNVKTASDDRIQTKNASLASDKLSFALCENICRIIVELAQTPDIELV